jgi:hypothetical protein
MNERENTSIVATMHDGRPTAALKDGLCDHPVDTVLHLTQERGESAHDLRVIHLRFLFSIPIGLQEKG